MNQVCLVLCKILFFITLVTLNACKEKKVNKQEGVVSNKTVTVRYENGKYQLYRHGQPFFIKGAGGYHFYERLQANGGNSIRIWDSNDAKRVLDEAQKLGLTVTVGLPVAHPRQGFDYTDERAVSRQLLEIKKIIETYKDHPALLMWCVGNELNYLSSKFDITDYKHIYSNMKVWQSVNDIAKMIHEVDPNHPTTTTLAGPSQIIRYITYFCPEIDILAVNIFGTLPNLSQNIYDLGWKGPYIVTEWGPTGYWESPRTSWDVAIEATSTHKGKLLKERYENSISKDTIRCLGSYIFMWDVKQERTHTWFSLFIDSGEEMSMVDDLHYLWNGKWPDNKSPVIEPVTINGKKATDNVVVTGDSICTAIVVAYDKEDTLKYKWEVLPELTGLNLNEGGDGEMKPEPINGLIVGHDNCPRISFKAPALEGPYRLFVYVFDGHQNVATANIPFYVLP